MEKTITREILKDKLYTGTQAATEFLYAKYSDMLHGFILQFVHDEEEAGNLLVRVFAYLSGRLEEACNSNLGVYCWLQIEVRKILLHYKKPDMELPFTGLPEQDRIDSRGGGGYYFSLLREASYEQKWVFRELFLIGRQKEEVARQLDKDLPYIDKLLRESLAIISKNLA